MSAQVEQAQRSEAVAHMQVEDLEVRHTWAAMTAMTAVLYCNAM